MTIITRHLRTLVAIMPAFLFANAPALASDDEHDDTPGHRHCHSHEVGNGHGHGHSRHHAGHCTDGGGGEHDDAHQYTAGTTQYFFNDVTDTPMVAIVYYPRALANGEPVPAGQTFPATVFMQGGNVDGGRYSWLRDLARHGYIVVVPDINPVATPKTDGSGINPNTKLTSVDVLERTVVNLHSDAANPQSEIFGRFNGEIAISGHSLGGVMAIMSVDEQGCTEAAGAIGRCPPLYTKHPSIVALWMIGGHYENPNGPRDTRPINKPEGFPIYTISGTEDGHSTQDEILATFDRYAEPKIWYEIDGANHLNWTDYLHPQDDIAKDLVATIDKEVQFLQTLDAVATFLDCSMKADAAACAAIPSTDRSTAP